MDTFEDKLAKATDPQRRELLGAIGLVVNSKGGTLYHHASGRQSLLVDSEPLDPDSNVFLASAGKFLTHIATLQLVEKGLIGLDESVYKHLPELAKLEIISASTDPKTKFTLRPQTKQITLRQMLTHSSGIGSGDEKLTEAWRAATSAQEWPEGTSGIVKMFSTPLLFEPGEGWVYGHSIHWLQPLIARVSGKTFLEYMQEHVFDVLSMTRSCYLPHTREDITSRLLQGVKRLEDGSVGPIPEGEELNGLACSIADVKAVFVDLLGPESKLLSQQHVDLLFEPAFEQGSRAVETIRKDEETFAKTIGYKPEDKVPVNFTCAGALIAEESLSGSHLPPMTLTWNGWPNVVWTMNREKGIATFFATQLIPVDDPQALVHIIEFLKCAWKTFGW